jgi:hypothetical protein
MKITAYGTIPKGEIEQCGLRKQNSSIEYMQS